MFTVWVGSKEICQPEPALFYKWHHFVFVCVFPGMDRQLFGHKVQSVPPTCHHFHNTCFTPLALCHQPHHVAHNVSAWMQWCEQRGQYRSGIKPVLATCCDTGIYRPRLKENWLNIICLTWPLIGSQVPKFFFLFGLIFVILLMAPKSLFSCPYFTHVLGSKEPFQQGIRNLTGPNCKT